MRFRWKHLFPKGYDWLLLHENWQYLVDYRVPFPRFFLRSPNSFNFSWILNFLNHLKNLFFELLFEANEYIWIWRQLSSEKCLVFLLRHTDSSADNNIFAPLISKLTSLFLSFFSGSLRMLVVVLSRIDTIRWGAGIVEVALYRWDYWVRTWDSMCALFWNIINA